MKTKKERTIVETITEYTCDFCGGKSIGLICSLCGKDLCAECTEYEPDTVHSDYPRKLCPSCYQVRMEYDERINDIRNAEEKIIQEWEEKAKTKNNIQIKEKGNTN